MEGMMTFVSLVVIVFGILQIILFFKLWGMTNDIKEIKEKYLNSENHHMEFIQKADNEQIDEIEPDLFKFDGLKFKQGDHVVNLKTEKQMRVKDIKDGKFCCYSQGGMVHEGDFDESELRKF